MSDVSLGDRMKEYEQAEAGRRCCRLLPTFARLDGKGFSSFTRSLSKPYDLRMSALMQVTAKELVEETNANCGYTQSDEITLMWYATTPSSQIYFDGKIQKMVSTLAALGSVFFNKELQKFLPEKAEESPTFDCRVWTVPTITEAINVFLWREQDATKNAISMAAQTVYSHSELMGMDGKQKQEMLFQKGINFNNYPTYFKRGTYIQRQSIKRKFTVEEIEKLPLKHEARSNPDLEVERTAVVPRSLPPLSTIENKAAVLFNGEEYWCS